MSDPPTGDLGIKLTRYNQFLSTAQPELLPYCVLIYQAEDVKELSLVNLQLAQMKLYWGLVLSGCIVSELLFIKFTASQVLRRLKCNC